MISMHYQSLLEQAQKKKYLPDPLQQAWELSGFIKLLKTHSLFCLLITASFLLYQLTNIDSFFSEMNIQRKTFLFSAAITHIYSLYFLDYKPIVIDHIVSSTLLTFELLMPSAYPWAVAVEETLKGIILVYVQHRYVRMLGYSWRFTFKYKLLSYEYLLMLTDAGILCIPWRFLMLMGLFYFGYLLLKQSFKILVWLKRIPFEIIAHKLGIVNEIVNSSLGFYPMMLTILTLISKQFIPESVFTFFLCVSLIINAVALFGSYYFPVQTYLTLNWLTFVYYEAVFRVHDRQFVIKYESDTCNRDIKWDEHTECLLCYRRAKIIYSDCMHLAVCLRCYEQQEFKSYYTCIICGKYYGFGMFLDWETTGVKYGYQRRVFLEKVLLKNQYVCH